MSARGFGEAVDTPRLRRFVLRLWHVENGARARRKIGPHEPGPRRLYRTCAGQEGYEAARGEFGLKNSKTTTLEPEPAWRWGETTPAKEGS